MTMEVPEHAKAGVGTVGQATEAEPLAPLQVGQNKGKVLHGHSFFRPVRRKIMFKTCLDQKNILLIVKVLI